MIVRVMKENSYASAIIEKREDQKVIETGPYKIVRHPMYTGGLIFILFTPVALGPYWAFILFLILTPIVLVLRIKGEEKYLIANLQGYGQRHILMKFHRVIGSATRHIPELCSIAKHFHQWYQAIQFLCPFSIPSHGFYFTSLSV